MEEVGKYKTEIKNSLEGFHSACKLIEQRTANLKIDQHRLHKSGEQREKKKHQEKKKKHSISKKQGTSCIQANEYNGWERRK